MSSFLRLAILAIVLIAATKLAYAEKRVALVIGNSKYEHTTQLAGGSK